MEICGTFPRTRSTEYSVLYPYSKSPSSPLPHFIDQVQYRVQSRYSYSLSAVGPPIPFILPFVLAFHSLHRGNQGPDLSPLILFFFFYFVNSHSPFSLKMTSISQEWIPSLGEWPVDPQQDTPISQDRIWVDGCFDFTHHGEILTLVYLGHVVRS